MLTKNKCLALLTFMLILLINIDSFSANAEEIVGQTPGEFRVDESGAGTFSIPINTPAGRAGVTPKIALTYSSNNLREGPVGVGWAVSGISSISRCPQTPIHDGGNIRAVEYNSSVLW